jgi:hypothetical protein
MLVVALFARLVSRSLQKKSIINRISLISRHLFQIARYLILLLLEPVRRQALLKVLLRLDNRIHKDRVKKFPLARYWLVTGSLSRGLLQ